MPLADPITDLYVALTTNYLCLLGALSFVALMLILLVILRIMRIRKEQNWAHNPDKSFKLKWRRG